MPRRYASLVQRDGSHVKLSRKIAFQLIESGEYTYVRRRPLVIRQKTYSAYYEEQRHLSGRIIPRCTRLGLNGQTSRGRGLRVIIARSSIDPEARKVNRYLREQHLCTS